MATVNTHTAGTVSWVDLMSKDSARAQAFYGSLFGWTFDIGGPETSHYAMAKKGDGQVAGIGGMPPGAAFPPVWNIYFATDSVDGSIEKIKANGGSVVMGPMDVVDAGRLAFCVDPTGAHFGLWQANKHHGAQRIDEVGAMCWREVMTRDSKRALEFYGRVFGLEPKKLDMSGPQQVDYWTLHKGPHTVGGLMQMGKEFDGVPPHWMNYFAVADTDAACARVTELGGKVSVPPFDTPYGRIAVVNDPDGAAFSVITQPKG